jgi:AcrR family transcriptional regulator
MSPARSADIDAASVWLRPEPPARRPRPVLDRDDITRVALELADRDGLAAVSMRRIATQLGVSAPSLYWHGRSKNELYELMADAVIGQVALPKRPSGDWRRDLRSIARATREALRRHSWYAQLGIQPMLGPQTQRYAQQASATLRDLGLTVAEQVEILAALNNYIVGFVHREHAWHEVTRRSGRSDARWRRMLEGLVADTAGEDPGLAEQMSARINLHGDESFEFGLTCMLDGIAARTS